MKALSSILSKKFILQPTQNTIFVVENIINRNATEVKYLKLVGSIMDKDFGNLFKVE